MNTTTTMTEKEIAMEAVKIIGKSYVEDWKSLSTAQKATVITQQAIAYTGWYLLAKNPNKKGLKGLAMTTAANILISIVDRNNSIEQFIKISQECGMKALLELEARVIRSVGNA